MSNVWSYLFSIVVVGVVFDFDDLRFLVATLRQLLGNTTQMAVDDFIERCGQDVVLAWLKFLPFCNFSMEENVPPLSEVFFLYLFLLLLLLFVEFVYVFF